MFVVRDMVAEMSAVAVVLVITLLSIAVAASAGRDWLARRRALRSRSQLRARVLREYAAACAPPAPAQADVRTAADRRPARRRGRAPVEAGNRIVTPPAKA
jgi:hypothetical protein